MIGALIYVNILLASPKKCFTEREVMDNVCHYLCLNDNANTGQYLPKVGNCLCGFRREYLGLTQPLIILPPVADKLSTYEPEKPKGESKPAEKPYLYYFE